MIHANLPALQKGDNLLINNVKYTVVRDSMTYFNGLKEWELLREKDGKRVYLKKEQCGPCSQLEFGVSAKSGAGMLKRLNSMTKGIKTFEKL